MHTYRGTTLVDPREGAHFLVPLTGNFRPCLSVEQNRSICSRPADDSEGSSGVYFRLSSRGFAPTNPSLMVSLQAYFSPSSLVAHDCTTANATRQFPLDKIPSRILGTQKKESGG